MGIIENKQKIKKYVPYMIGIGILLVFVFIFFNNSFQSVNKAWDNFDERTQSLSEEGEAESRMNNMFFSPFHYHGSQLLFGSGLGATYQGIQQVFGVSDTVKAYGYMESESERIVFEGGYTLFLLRVLLFILVLSAIKIARWEKWVIFLLFINGMIVFNTYMTFFLAMGLIWLNSSSNNKLCNLKQNE
jgi:hypothetical protein